MVHHPVLYSFCSQIGYKYSTLGYFSSCISILFLLFITGGPPVIENFASKVATEGDVVTFICKSMQSAEITFYVDGTPMSDVSLRSKYEVNCQELRTLYKVNRFHDNAVFTCKASNMYGFDIKNATLHVLGECSIMFSVVQFGFEED